MKVKYKIVILGICMTILGYVNAQTIEGKVVSEDGEAIPFAKIELKQSEIRVRTNLEGIFTIKNNNSSISFDTLVVTCVGYITYRMPINISSNQLALDIRLNHSVQEIDEVIVRALKFYSANDIIEKAIKKTKKNYQNQTTNLKGFYREVISESNKCILLNEACLDMNYAGYPQKGYTNGAFRTYYDYDYLPWNRFKHSVFRHLVYFPDYVNPKKDEISIQQTRSSIDYSEFGAFSSTIGGPIDLIALDKIKYQDDFFNTKLVHKYTYKNESQSFVNGIKCYVVRFYPKKDDFLKVQQSFNKKNQSAIYTGRVFISGDDFSVLKIEYEFAENLDYSIYSYFNGIIGPPKDVRVTVEYGMFDDKYILKKVQTFQTKDYVVDLDKGTSIQYECFRTLILGDYSHQKKKFSEDELSYLTKSFHINNFSKHYADSIWEEVEKSDLYTPLHSDIRESLEKYLPLNDQFKRVNISVDQIQPPIARIDSTINYNQNDTLLDCYSWLEDYEDSAVVNYLKQENLYSENALESISASSSRGIQIRMNNLFQEIYKSPDLDEEKTSNELRENNGIRFKFGKDEEGEIYLIKVLNNLLTDSILNVSQFANGKLNFVLEEVRFSDKELLAISNSIKGGYSKTLTVFGDSKQQLVTIDSTDGFRWLNDSCLIYVKQNKQLRNFQIRLHNVYNKMDSLIYEEVQSSYIMHISEDESKQHIVIESRSLSDNKIQLVKIREKDCIPQVIFAHKKNQFGDIVSDKDGRAFISVNLIGNVANIYPLVQGNNLGESIYQSNRIIEDVVLTKNYIVLTEFWLNQYNIAVINRDNFEVQKYFVVDSVQHTSIVDPNFDDDLVTILLSSPTTPFKQFELDLKSNQMILKHHVAIRNQKPNVEMINVSASDSKLIPLMLLSNPTVLKDSIKGIILRAYGAYGYPQQPRFNDMDQVFVEMGYVVAYAYVRGGGELGIEWHLSGRRENKVNSFTDYVACAKFLKEYYQVDKSKMVGMSASAGGLIMGYVANNYSDLFGALVFDRPFMDPLSMMSDSVNVLTEVEFDEWGNPAIESDYKILKSYSPYQNISSKEYPNMLFLAGYYDDQAPYWQVAKSAVSYRKNNLSNTFILMSTDMESGHKGRAGNDQSLNKQRIAKFILYATGNED